VDSLHLPCGNPSTIRELTAEVWEAGGKSRITMKDFWYVMIGNTRWSFSTLQKTVFVSHIGANGFGDAQTLPSLEKAFKTYLPGETVKVSRTTEDGKPVLQLTNWSWFETYSKDEGKKRYPLETIWTADPNDMLPRKEKHFQAVHGGDRGKVGMRQIGYSTIEYPSDYPAGIFDTSVPKGWKVVHLPDQMAK